MVYIGPLLDPSFSFNVLFRAVDVVNFNWRSGQCRKLECECNAPLEDLMQVH